jgi:PST family polysaccharide transporter
MRRHSSTTSSGLGTRAARSGAIVATGRVLQGVVGLTTATILARLLTPADFGVFAMVLPVALIVTMTINRGLHMAVMHEAELSPAQVTRLFWIAQRFNVLLLGGMALSAPLLARLYREPRVTVVALMWALALVFQSLGVFAEAVLKRQIRFGVLAAIELGTMVVGVTASITAAALGHHNIALVTQVLVWQTLRCVGAYVASQWWPDLPTRAHPPDPTIDRLVRYGSNFGFGRAVYWLGRQVDRMIVGYVSGAAVLGLYDGARRWSWYPFQELFLAMTDVVVSSLSRARSDVTKFREYCRRGFTAFLALPMPAIAFIGLEPELVVRVLLGERWLAAAPMVRIMCGAAFLDSIGRLTSWLNSAEGNTRQQLEWSAVSTVVTLAAVVATARNGAVAVTWAFAIATATLVVPGVIYCLRNSQLRGADFLLAVWRPATSAILAALLWLVLRTALPTPGVLLVRLLVSGIAFVALYVLAWIALPGGRAATREGVEMLRAIGAPRVTSSSRAAESAA